MYGNAPPPWAKHQRRVGQRSSTPPKITRVMASAVSRGKPATWVRLFVRKRVPLRGRLGRRPVAEGGRGGREKLSRHFRAVHVFDATRGIEGVGGEVPVEGRAEVELAPRGGITFQPGPAVASEAGREVG